MHNTESWYLPFREITHEIFFSRLTLKEGVDALIELIPSVTPDGVDVRPQSLYRIIAEEIVQMSEEYIARVNRKKIK